MVAIIFGIGKSLRLTPSATFLASLLSKNFLASIKEKVPFETIDEIAQVSLLLASKMRERDIYCPMISHIREVSGRSCPVNRLKARELQVASFYQWNISMLTFYDYLEQFLAMGVLLATDVVEIDRIKEKLRFIGKISDDGEENFRTSEEEEHTEDKSEIEEKSNKLTEEQIKIEDEDQEEVVSEEVGSEPKSPKEQKVPKTPSSNISKNKLETPSRSSPPSESKTSLAKDLPTSERDILIDSIERRCLDIALQLTHRFITDPSQHKELAYIIISLARKEAGIKNSDRDLLKEYYSIKPIIGGFAAKIGELGENCQDMTDQLCHDLVVRSYDQQGREMLPEGLMIKQATQNPHNHPESLLKELRWSRDGAVRPELFPEETGSSFAATQLQKVPFREKIQIIPSNMINSSKLGAKPNRHIIQEPIILKPPNNKQPLPHYHAFGPGPFMQVRGPNPKYGPNANPKFRIISEEELLERGLKLGELDSESGAHVAQKKIYKLSQGEEIDSSRGKISGEEDLETSKPSFRQNISFGQVAHSSQNQNPKQAKRKVEQRKKQIPKTASPKYFRIDLTGARVEVPMYEGQPGKTNLVHRGEQPRQEFRPKLKFVDRPNYPNSFVENNSNHGKISPEKYRPILSPVQAFHGQDGYRMSRMSEVPRINRIVPQNLRNGIRGSSIDVMGRVSCKFLCKFSTE